MRHFKYKDAPEFQASTGFPITVILLSMIAIIVYLVSDGELVNKAEVMGRVYVPIESATVIATSSTASHR